MDKVEHNSVSELNNMLQSVLKPSTKSNCSWSWKTESSPSGKTVMFRTLFRMPCVFQKQNDLIKHEVISDSLEYTQRYVVELRGTWQPSVKKAKLKTAHKILKLIKCGRWRLNSAGYIELLIPSKNPTFTPYNDIAMQGEEDHGTEITVMSVLDLEQSSGGVPFLCSNSSSSGSSGSVSGNISLIMSSVSGSYPKTQFTDTNSLKESSNETKRSIEEAFTKKVIQAFLNGFDSGQSRLTYLSINCLGLQQMLHVKYMKTFEADRKKFWAQVENHATPYCIRLDWSLSLVPAVSDQLLSNELSHDENPFVIFRTVLTIVDPDFHVAKELGSRFAEELSLNEQKFMTSVFATAKDSAKVSDSSATHKALRPIYI